MGRTTRWLKSLIGSSKSDHPPPPKQNNNNNNSNNNNNKKKKSKWGFNNNNNNRRYSYNNNDEEDHIVAVGDANRHAIAVAEATAVVAEAALAAAQAAAEVVRLTTGGSGISRPGTGRRRRDWAAVKIQSSFRAYLARRALRALKGLVRLQALVRGHIVRSQSADMLRRMQSLARIQARVCANRAHISESSQSSTKSSKTRNPGIATPKKQDKKLRAYSLKSDRSPTQKNGQTKIKNKGSIDLETALKGSNWLNRWMEECSWNNQGDQSLTNVRPDDERSDKILEVDTCYPHLNLNLTEKLRTSSHHATSYGYGDHGVTLSESLSRHSSKSRKKNLSVSSCESSLKYPTQIDETAVWTTENSPQVLSRPGSSGGRKGPFTPAKSECSRSFFNGYHGYPNYMSNTESYRAKVRSQSAPRQRIPLSTTRFYNGYCDSETISENGSALQDNFKVKAYSGSGRSDRPVIPVRGNYNSTYADRH